MSLSFMLPPTLLGKFVLLNMAMINRCARSFLEPI